MSVIRSFAAGYTGSGKRIIPMPHIDPDSFIMGEIADRIGKKRSKYSSIGRSVGRAEHRDFFY